MGRINSNLESPHREINDIHRRKLIKFFAVKNLPPPPIIEGNFLPVQSSCFSSVNLRNCMGVVD